MSYAIVIAALLLAIYYVNKSQKSGFYTMYANEAPTRTYTPYTGTDAVGPWGAKPWGETAMSMVPTLCQQ